MGSAHGVAWCGAARNRERWGGRKGHVPELASPGRLRYALCAAAPSTSLPPSLRGGRYKYGRQARTVLRCGRQPASIPVHSTPPTVLQPPPPRRGPVPPPPLPPPVRHSGAAALAHRHPQQQVAGAAPVPTQLAQVSQGTVRQGDDGRGRLHRCRRRRRRCEGGGHGRGPGHSSRARMSQVGSSFTCIVRGCGGLHSGGLNGAQRRAGGGLQSAEMLPPPRGGLACSLAGPWSGVPPCAPWQCSQMQLAPGVEAGGPGARGPPRSHSAMIEGPILYWGPYLGSPARPGQAWQGQRRPGLGEAGAWWGEGSTATAPARTQPSLLVRVPRRWGCVVGPWAGSVG